MSEATPILTGLHDIAGSYDALFCDVWGVLHNGRAAHGGAVAALRAFRAARGPIILLSNAPRPVADLEEQFQRFGVPGDCYDAIVTSGVLTRNEIARRAEDGRVTMLHIGPERDRGIFAGLPVDCVDAAHASLVLCTGLFDDDHEVPDDYRDMLSDLAERRLPFICANPDIVVQRGGVLIYCAGALARLYDELGGHALYCGKPHRPIYHAALAAARSAAGRETLQVLAIGDGLETDIRGANGAGLDALFIADGIHGEDVHEVTPAAIGALCARAGVSARAAMRTLVW